MSGHRLPPFLVGTNAYNTHVQQIARALHEAGALQAFLAGGVDVWRHPVTKAARRAIASALPAVDRELGRRAIREIRAEQVQSHWRWEWARVLASRTGAPTTWEDWLWERGELALDRACARRLVDSNVGAFLGVEHGALAALGAARATGKPGVVAFLSPHHATRARWVDVEFERRPDWRTAGQSSVAALAGRRDARRDAEARAADWILTGSSFTTRSLVDAGFPIDRILTVPLGGPMAMAAGDLPDGPPAKPTFVYAGGVSVHKGVTYLLRAWRLLAPAKAELHLYGRVTVPREVLAATADGLGGPRVFVHGPVPSEQLPGIYRNASALILPSLGDGFGQVVSDALANGLPVITTTNTGAADCISHGRSGFVVPPADADALADRLAWCLDHPADLWDMRRAALASAIAWTWPHFRRRLVEVFEEALHGPATGELRALA